MNAVAREGFQFADELGPIKIVYLHDPATPMAAVLVVDNVAIGPSIGGVRMAPDVSTAECFRLARAMTLKNAAAGLPHGGGKAVIYGDPGMALRDKERMMRSFARAIGDLHEYIPGPDMGTDETAMAWVRDEIGRAVGLPRSLGGIPLDEIGATGHGLRHAVAVSCAHFGRALEGQRVAVQGFGSVGTHAARLLAEDGARVVAVADSRGALADPDGLPVDELIALKARGQSVVDLGRGEVLPREAVIEVDCDIFVPAARPDVVHEGNVDAVKAWLVAPGANIPMTDEMEARLHARDVCVLPDFIANAGGVICASVEYHGGTEATALETIESKVRANTAAVLEAAKASGKRPREAAIELAMARVHEAMGLHRFAAGSAA